MEIPRPSGNETAEGTRNVPEVPEVPESPDLVPATKPRRKRFVPPTPEQLAKYRAEVADLYARINSNAFKDLKRLMRCKGPKPYPPAWALFHTLVLMHKVDEDTGDFAGRKRHAKHFNQAQQFVTNRKHLSRLCWIFTRDELSEKQVARGLAVLEKLEIIHRARGAGETEGSIIYLRLHPGRIKRLMDHPETVEIPKNTVKFESKAGGGETDTSVRSISSNTGAQALPAPVAFGPPVPQSIIPSKAGVNGKPAAPASQFCREEGVDSPGSQRPRLSAMAPAAPPAVPGSDPDSHQANTTIPVAAEANRQPNVPVPFGNQTVPRPIPLALLKQTK